MSPKEAPKGALKGVSPNGGLASASKEIAAMARSSSEARAQGFRPGREHCVRGSLRGYICNEVIRVGYGFFKPLMVLFALFCKGSFMFLDGL